MTGPEKERDIVLPAIDATPEEIAQALFAPKPRPTEGQGPLEEEGEGEGWG